MAVQILYESENFLVVNKPYDMYINSNDVKETNTVSYHVARPDSHLSTSSYPLYFVHRLDYATSGVLCISKNKKMAALAGKHFEKRETNKYYLAIVRGHLEIDICDIKYEIGMDSTKVDSNHAMIALTSATQSSSCLQPRGAHTRLLRLETGYYDKDPVSVVLLKPITGRRHQLRVHCSAIGHTVLGDYTYSNKQDCTPHRMYLHAARLVLPLEHEPLNLYAQETFFSDDQFKPKWKSENELYKYRSKEDFLSVCNEIDKSHIIGAKHKLYYST